MKQFLFLYPISEIINFEIEKGSYNYFNPKKEKEFSEKLKKANSENEKNEIRKNALIELKEEFREIYKDNLNKCIDLRYRNKGFKINHAVFDDCSVSDVINLEDSDNIIKIGLDFKTHTTEQPDGSYLYLNSDFILDQLGETSVVRIAGFHLWDCVDRVAKRAYERGLDVLVDEDLTELFALRLNNDSYFRNDTYPSYDAGKEMDSSMFELFMEQRKERPWLWQNY